MQCDGEMDCAEGLDEWDVLCSKSDKLFYRQHMSNYPFPSPNWSNSRKKLILGWTFSTEHTQNFVAECSRYIVTRLQNSACVGSSFK